MALGLRTRRIIAGYWLYSVVRNAVTAEESDAIARARDVVRIERDLGIYREHAVNAFVAAHSWLAYICNYYYATLHFVVTIGVGIWLYRRHPLHARQLRTSWYLMNFLALFGFRFFPLAPPRLLPGDQFHRHRGRLPHLGLLGRPVGGAAQQPVRGYAVDAHRVVAVGRDLGGVPRSAHLGAGARGALPFATLLVIVGTGNHYWVDAVGGAAACLSGLFVARVVTRRPILPRIDSRDVLAQGRTSAPLDDAVRCP